MDKIYSIKTDYGCTIYYKNESFHREDGPAKEWDFGGKEWYYNSRRHRVDGPAIIWPNGEKYYYLSDIYYPDIKSDEEWIKFQISLAEERFNE